MSYLQTFQVYPKVPKKLAFAEKMVRNMWWSWNLDAIELLRRIDPGLWNASGRNPIQFFSLLSQDQLEKISEDEALHVRFTCHVYKTLIAI